MGEKFCGLDDAGLEFENNNPKAKYIESYVEGMMHYNFISNMKGPNGDNELTKMIRKILLQDEKINGNIIFELSKFFSYIT